MAKSKAKPTKVTKQELETIQGLVSNINESQMRVGGLEIQKKYAMDQVLASQEKLQVYNRTLQEKYGLVSVNIQDGSLKPLPKNEVNKKN
tara:strand:- start:1153 stop:1422 length:270 start_codon:yes stop_codon:yes gene_type:complete